MNLAGAFARAAVRDQIAAVEQLRDRADDVLLGAPGMPGNWARAAYYDRWAVAIASGWSGPFDPRFGSLRVSA